LSEEELIKRHDEVALKKQRYPDLDEILYYLDELDRREQAKSTKTMVECTKRIECYTIVITVATVLNFVFFVYSIFK